MGDYADYRISQARLDRVRERAARQKRMALLGAGVLAALVVVFALASGLRREKVAPPNVVLTWPSPEKYGHRLFLSNIKEGDVVNLGEILMRPGQPFSVALHNGDSWDSTLVSSQTNTSGQKARWQPAKDGDTLKIFARKKTYGWRKIFAWTQPKQELRFVARSAKSLNANLRELNVEQPVWISQNVVTESGTQTWDQRAIPVLEAVEERTNSFPSWQLVSAFNAKAERTSDDKGSYFRWRGREMMEQEDVPLAMTEIAREIAERAPTASIKWIVDGNKSTLRIEFDGSGARGGWVKNEGESEATPLRWWDKELGEEEIRERLAPSLPR